MSTQPSAEPASPPDGACRSTFLEQMRQVPGAVAVIASAIGPEKGGLVATAWSSLCADPPMLLACVNRSASAHEHIVEAGAFGLSLLSTTDGEVVGHFSGKDALSGTDRFVEGLWSEGPGGQPLLNSATVAFECVIEDSHVYGTHTILIGRVTEMRRNAGAKALLYLDGKYASAAPA